MQGVALALKQQDVAGLETNAAEAGPWRHLLAGDRQEVDAIAVVYPQATHRPPFDRRIGHQHGLDHADFVGIEIFVLEVASAGLLQLVTVEQRLQGRGVALQDQDIVLPQAFDAGGRQKPALATVDGHHRHLVLAGLLEVSDGRSDQRRAVRHNGLGDVGFDAEEIHGLRLALPVPRDETPANEREVEQS